MRLFIAVTLSEEVRRGIWTATERLRGTGLPVRWVEPAGLHLTLKFLGEVDDDRRDEIAQGVETATRGARPFQLPVSGFGAFPSVERPRVIWVGCEGVPALELLQHHVEREMERLGFAVEGRPFRPHVTLGRAKQDGSPARFRGLPSIMDGLAYEGDTPVRSLELMESRLGPDGAAYRPVRSVDFES